MKRVLNEKFRRLAQHPDQGPSARLFWRDLSKAIGNLTETPVESGEILFHHRHVELIDYAAVFGPIAMQYAVNEQDQAVFVVKLAISRKHPYPPEFVKILNSEPS